MKYYKYNLAKSKLSEDSDLKAIKERCELVNFNSHSKCPLCNERICLPYRSTCEHAFCYLCVTGAEIISNSFFYCPACKKLQPKDQLCQVILSSGSC